MITLERHRPRHLAAKRTARRGSLRLILLLALLAAPVAGFAQITAPAYNWKLPVFTDEGYYTMLARGSRAQMVSDSQFEIEDLNLTMFSGDAAARVENVILSPSATFLPGAKTARGEKSVRFIGDGVEASGTRWIYFHDLKKISLDGSVTVIFQAELKSLLQ